MRFTIFTSTYNRAHTLQASYEGLCIQTFRNFEWLIINDGSSDYTEQLVQQWIGENRINIRYFTQMNCGKHVALNRAVKEARGELFFILDSDDRCVADTLEKLDASWLSIPENVRQRFSGASFLCMDRDRNLIGDRFAKNLLGTDAQRRTGIYVTAGDKGECYRIDILKQYPFPEFQDEKFIAEGIVWNRIAQDFLTLYINVPLKIVEYHTEGLSANMLKVRVESPNGSRLYYLEYLTYSLSLIERFKTSINYFRFGFHSKIACSKMISEMPQSSMYTIVLPLSWLFMVSDKYRIKNIFLVCDGFCNEKKL